MGHSSGSPLNFGSSFGVTCLAAIWWPERGGFSADDMGNESGADDHGTNEACCAAAHVAAGTLKEFETVGAYMTFADDGGADAVDIDWK